MNLTDFEAQLREQTRALLLRNLLSKDARAERVAIQVVCSGFNSLAWEDRFLYLGRVSPLIRDAVANVNSLSAAPSGRT
jgi:hypothetical protein